MHWLVDMTNLLNAARISKADQVEVVRIQQIDMARTWWLAEEERLEQPIAWEKFMDSFNERFFSITASREMEQLLAQNPITLVLMMINSCNYSTNDLVVGSEAFHSSFDDD